MLDNIKFDVLVDMSRHDIVPAHIADKNIERRWCYG